MPTISTHADMARASHYLPSPTSLSPPFLHPTSPRSPSTPTLVAGCAQVAAEPVWYLPGIAERFGVSEMDLRQALFRETNMM